MAQVRFIRGIDASIAAQAITDGTIWIATDTKTAYIDTDSERISFLSGGSVDTDAIVEEVLNRLPAAEANTF